MKQNTLRHIGLIPDGNRRWAKQNNRPQLFGHKFATEETTPKLYEYILEQKIPYCTFWALSSENLKGRSQRELDNLFLLLRQFLKRRLDEIHEKNIKLNIIGAVHELPNSLQQTIQTAIDTTKDNTGLVFSIGLNYGGKQDIVQAVQQMMRDNLPPEKITEESIQEYLYTRDIPNPDLIIRTGGEKRTSGFLLWQSAYTEYAFTDTLYPDFSPEELQTIIDNYYHRERRFGK